MSKFLGRLLGHLSLHKGHKGAALLGGHSDATDLPKNVELVPDLLTAWTLLPSR